MGAEGDSDKPSSTADAKTVNAKVALARAVPWAVAALALGLLIAHSLEWDWVTVDGVTLGLLGALLVTSSWDRVRKLKLGEFEAEIAPAEVARVQAEASVQVGPPELVDADDEHRDLVETLRTDPTLGLAGVRIELERWLRSLHRVVAQPTRRQLGAGQMAHDLSRSGVLTPPLASTLSEVLSIANRAIHGELIRRDDALSLGMIGVQLIDELRELYFDTMTAPLETEVISPAERDELLDEKRYRVVTVMPLVDEPKRNVRILDQDALNDFLDEYNTFAEFLVSVEPIEAAPAEPPRKRPRPAKPPAPPSQSRR